MTKIVLDTDVLLDVLRGRKAALVFLEDMADRFVPSCSVISVAEIFSEMRQEEEQATRTLLDGLVIIPVTQDMAEVAGRFKRRTKTRRLELADCLIAATVFVEGAALATGNMKDYPMPEITVIKARRTSLFTLSCNQGCSHPTCREGVPLAGALFFSSIFHNSSARILPKG